MYFFIGEWHLYLCFICLFQAAKLDPHLGSAFRYLGHYYRDVANDSGRAHGCYKKAFQLDGDDTESGAASVDLSMGQGDMVCDICVLLVLCNISAQL